MIGIDDILLAVAPDAIKGFVSAIPNAFNKYKFKKFFGKKILESDKAFIVLDPYEHPISSSQLYHGQTRFIKKFHGKKNDVKIIGEDKLLGGCSIRVSKYSTEVLSNYRSKREKIKIVFDEDVINSWDGTYFCFGSSDSNIKTFDVESLPQNKLYSFGYGTDGYRCFIIDGKQFSISDQKDKAVLARFVNPYHNEHYLFICSGLGAWGTSGA
ncbi:MAG: hypothetical protein ABR980_12260, partial [Ignavibacteriaceae bacterium]